MGELTLSNGSTVTVDVSKMTVREWRDFITPNGPAERDDEIVAKCCGLELEALTDLPYLDYRRLVLEIVKLARSPLADPNLASASTLPV